jgi:hypothetical protein
MQPAAVAPSLLLLMLCLPAQVPLFAIPPNHLTCTAVLVQYIFPGLALGAFLARGNIVTDGMLMAAAESLSRCVML